MRCSASGASLALFGMLLAQTAVGAPAEPSRAPLAHIAILEGRAEVARAGTDWRSALEGEGVSIGDRLRVGPDSVARLELPWMALTLGGGAWLRFSDELLLSARLEGGRVLVDSREREILKILAGSALVQGRGRAIIRRESNAVLVTCLEGSFRVVGSGGSVTLPPGYGSAIAEHGPPSRPAPAPAAPTGIWPARDPVYVQEGSPLALRWEGDAPSYQIELLPVGTEVVLLQRDVARSPASIQIPWAGAFRWRVSARDRQGLEGAPSQEGLIAVE